jgi:hypothetical protein
MKKEVRVISRDAIDFKHLKRNWCLYCDKVEPKAESACFSDTRRKLCFTTLQSISTLNFKDFLHSYPLVVNYEWCFPVKVPTGT